jgi:hypothetical protein
MRRSAQVVLLCLLSLPLASCGKSPTDAGGDQLTQQESLALYSEISLALSQALANVSNSGSPARAPAAAPTTFSGSINSSTACSAGGTAAVIGSYNGSYDTQGTDYTYSYDMTMAFNSCQTSGQASQVTITGDPSLTITGDFHWTGTTYDYTYTEQGGIAFTTSDGRSGSCQISYSSTVTYDGTKSSVSLTGSVCGTDISAAGSG